MKPEFAVFLFFLAFLACAQSQTDWWKNTIVYQVYPRSFQDSDGDGTGDIKGIQSRLPHIKDLGVETIWISPIYKSPMVDFGYDISDFVDVDETFGTLQDFSELVAAAHELGIKIVMDYVPNHSSNQHDWFLKSIAREDPYTDYYVWKDPSGFDLDGKPLPPNNWLSVFRFSAWTWNEERGQFYYHAFTPEQPDLNYRNPLVVEEMKNVIRFWVGQMGIDGMRMDAVPFLFENTEFLDEPLSNKTDDSDSYDYLQHIYTFNLPEVYDMIRQFYNVLKEFEIIDGQHRVVMVEALSADLSIQDLMQYYDVCDFAFNFNFVVHLDSEITNEKVLAQILDWMNNMPQGKTANWVLDNHDNPRVASKFGPQLVDPMNIISMTLPGVAVSYYGDEIGMTNANISYEETVDPAGCNCGPEGYKTCSRDPERTPMQWSTAKNAGFSDAGKTWLPVNPNYAELNVEAQKSAEQSSLKVYKALTKLRLEDERLKSGLLDTSSLGKSLGLARFDPSTNEAILVVVNFSSENDTNDFAPIIPGMAKVILRSSSSANPDTVPGSEVDLSKLTLGPYEAVVIDFSPL